MINLLYCGNLHVFDGIMLSLMSAASKCSKPFTAYIMTMDLRHLDDNYAPLETAHINILNTVVKKSNPKNSIILLDATQTFVTRLEKSSNLFTEYTPYCLLRLFAAEFDLPERLLYLDADTMFNGDPCKIEDYDITDYEMGVVLDHLGKRFIAKDYINTGVLYLNLKKIKKTRLFEKALDLCLNKKMVFPDQDALNELLAYKLYLPAKFNRQSKLKKDDVIQHFSKTIRFFPLLKVINVKQWQVRWVHKILKLHAYDNIYENFFKYRSKLGKDLLAPLPLDAPPSFFKQLKYTFKELKSYLSQNGGIFRRKTKQNKGNKAADA